MPCAPEPGAPTPARTVRDNDLVHQVLHGGMAGEHAGLELLLRKRPGCWEDAVALLKPAVASRHALDALQEAWRTYRRIERSEATRAMSARRRVVHAVYDSDEFNALVRRLPRAIRRSVEPAPPGHIGLIVQIVSADDCTLATTHAHVPAQADLARALARLEAAVHEQLG